MCDEKYIVKNGKKLRFGYTTGSCSVATTSAAVRMLLNGGLEIQSVATSLPNGENVIFMIDDVNVFDGTVVCSVTKDAGDDPDVTDKIKIYAKAKLCDKGVTITTGKGIGTVTAKGLKCKIGEPAINPVPKKMILQNIEAVFSEFAYRGGVTVELFIPMGEEVAKHTFNERLGIMNGISILGTTGIVEPMSEQALIDTIKILIDKQREIDGEKILISPGNYGKDYCKNNLHIDVEKGIKYSNYIGETLDYLVYSGYKKVLIVGHIGKLVKLAGGIMNTHSSYADCRMEIISAHTALCGGEQELIYQIMSCLTTDEAIEILEKSGINKAVFESIMEKILFQINYRTKNKLQAEVIIFGSEDKIVAKSKNADEFAKLFEEESSF